MESSHSRKSTVQELWARILNRLRGSVNEFGYEGLISKLNLLEDTGTHLVIAYPADLCIEWVEVNYTPQICQAALDELQEARQLSFRCEERPNEQPASPDTELPMPGVPAPSTPKKREPRRTPRTFINSCLNENYRFDNFVVGNNSEFAFAAAKSLASSPRCKYRLLMIHGAPGMGKTHLLHAIGNAIKEKNDSCQVLYITGEAFTNEYIEAISKSRRGNTMESFHKKYRKVDVLLLDDVQFLSGKNKTQEEFFHTFNSLFETQKRIVLSSDSPVSEIIGVEPRLASRFESGLTVSIESPSPETRKAILLKKCSEWNCSISGDVLDFLAENITKDVRRLEGALMRIAVMASFSQTSPSLETVRMLLKDELKEGSNSHRITVGDIQKAVAHVFDLRIADITGRRRTAQVAHSRQIAMYLSRKHTNLSLQDIGSAFGGRDHGTVIHATRTVERKMADDAEVRKLVARLEDVL
ncbi:MAG: chromosomal replication initiator protein DnaA [Akkermansiaceae bacterium]|nr:chromosomal replication initiator protein DnaA [Akkermansiaceae bacterium]